MHITYQVLLYSVIQASISTFLSLAIALCLLPGLQYISGAVQRLVLGFSAVLSMISTTLVALSVQTLFGLHGLPGIITSHVIINAPFALYMLHGAYQKIDYTLLLVAQELGASRMQLYRTIIIPCMYGALVSSATLIFVLCFSSFSVIKVLADGPEQHTFTVLISSAYKGGYYALMWLCFAVRLAVIMPLIIVPSLVAARFSAHIATPMQEPDQRKTRIKRIACVLLVCALGAAHQSIGVPLYELYDVVQRVCAISWAQIFLNTAFVAICSSIASVILGAVLCWYGWFSNRAGARRLSVMMAHVPFFMGGVVIAYCCKSLAVVGSGYMLLIFVQMFLHYPFAFRLLHTQMGAYNPEWALHAQVMGATRWQWLQTIYVPFFATVIKRSALLTFGLSLTDAGVMSVLSNSSEATLAIVVHTVRDAGYTAHALALSACTQLFFLVLTIFSK